MLSTPPSRREWGWGWRSVARLLRITAGDCGRQRMKAEAQCFSLRCQEVARGRHDRSQRLFIVDDDEAMRHSLKNLIQSGATGQNFASVQEFLHGKLTDVPHCLVLDVQYLA